MSAISPFAQGGGFPFITGFGPTSTPGGFSSASFGFPGITGFGFPPPGVDPFFFFTPAASSFNINRLLGGANGTAVPINIGPTPSTMGISPFLLGFPFFGGGSGGSGNGAGTGGASFPTPVPSTNPSSGTGRIPSYRGSNLTGSLGYGGFGGFSLGGLFGGFNQFA